MNHHITTVFSTKGQGQERGAVVITVAIALVALMGMLALALDGGAAYNVRRGTQNAADNTAMAAAWAHCMDEPDPIDHAREFHRSAGYDDPEVTIEHVDGGDFDAQYQVTITTVNANNFGGVIGIDETTVVSTATAACERAEGGGAAAMFARGPECQLVKGGNATIAGFVYSAGDMTWNGGGSQDLDGDMHSDADIIVNGPLNISGTASASGTSNNPGVIEGAPQLNLPYPVDFQISDFAPGSPIAVAAGDQYYQYPPGSVNRNNLSRTGIHYVQGNITTVNNVGDGNPITIVATGTISGNNYDLTAYHDGLAIMAGAFSPPRCDDAIDLGGSSDIAGILFAPNGQLSVHGGAVNGGMIAWSINTGGSLVLDVDASLFPGGLPQVFLLE